MLSALVQVIEHCLVRLVAHLQEVLVDSYCLVLSVLTWAAVSGVYVELSAGFLSRKDGVVEVFTVPPETRTHAYGFRVSSGTSVSSITADKSS